MTETKSAAGAGVDQSKKLRKLALELRKLSEDDAQECTRNMPALIAHLKSMITSLDACLETCARLFERKTLKDTQLHKLTTWTGLIRARRQKIYRSAIALGVVHGEFTTKKTPALAAQLAACFGPADKDRKADVRILARFQNNLDKLSRDTAKVKGKKSER